MQTAIRAQQLWTGTTLIDEPLVLLEEGHILSMTSAAAAPPGVSELHFPAATLAPSYFDVHIHGAAGHDLMEATPEAVRAASALLAAHGVGAYLATTVTAPLDDLLRALAGLARLIAAPPTPSHAPPVGIHLEGPFLACKKRGVHPAQHLLEPNPALFNRLQEAAEGHIRLMTLAPELPGACELAAHAVAQGTRVSLGHSDASAAQSRALIASGASSATHTFNAMRPLEAREPGILGTVLTDEALFAELICDGVHTAPEIVQLWWKMKGAARGILVTDALSATGMPDGRYQLGGLAVDVANGRATAEGVLAGSLLTLDRALENLMRFTGATLTEALPLVTTNPARLTGWSDRIGSLAAGRPANLVALDENGRLLASFLNGAAVNLNGAAVKA